MALAKHPANWAMIRAAFEGSPLSIRSIAAKFGVPKSTLLGRIRSEHWQRSADSHMTALGDGPTGDGPTDTTLSAPVDVVAIAQRWRTFG